jgi:hypothetical protein
MKMKQFIILTTLTLAMSLSLNLTSTVRADDTTAKPDASDSLRCERFKMSSVSDLKEKLADYCNLDKPYSFSANDMLGGNPWVTYCCRKKGT